MTNSSTTAVSRHRTPRFAIVIGGLIAGAFDIAYAIVFSGLHGVPAIRILQSVASGLLGTAAYDGGVPTAALGLVLHFAIMVLIAAVYHVASRRVPLLVQRPVIAGSIFGFIVFFAMNLVVLPLSAFPGKVSFAPGLLAANLIVHMFLIGVPIALAARGRFVHAA